MSNMDKCAPMREKFWKELSIEEKIERMRNIIKNQSHQIETTRARVDLLDRHSHLDGNIVTRFEKSYPPSMQIERKSKDDEVYF